MRTDFYEQVPNVTEGLREQIQRTPDATFVSVGTTKLTYQQFGDRTQELADTFASMGLSHGAPVAVFLRNSHDMLAVVFGLARVGAVPVLLNTEFQGVMLAHVLTDSQAVAVVSESDLVSRIEVVADQCQDLRTVMVREQLADLAATGTERAVEPTFGLRDPFIVLYTSGTTGPSKGVVVSHGQALSWAFDWVTAMDYHDDDVLFSSLPLFHGIGFLLGLVPTMMVGAQMHLEERFSASRFWDTVIDSGATVAHTIFSIIPILLSAAPDPQRDRAHSLRAVYVGPSKLSPAFEERFGVPVVEVFGQTETGLITYAPLGTLRPGSCGKVNDRRFEVRCVDAHDNPVPTGQIGEIVVRPKQPWSMMTGYLNRPESSVEAFRNLWYHTGDLGRFDDEGWMYFVGRATDSIRRRGENISAYEVELIVSRYSHVVESAAIAVPSEIEEDELKVCLVVRDRDTFNVAEFIEFCVREMPAFMVPRFVELYESLPKTSTQKTLKSDLRDVGQQGLTPTTWDRTTRAMWVPA